MILAGAVIVGNAAGETVIVLDTEAKALPQESVAVQVSVTVPPQAEGVALKVEALDVPLIAQLPLKPLLNERVLGAGKEPQATVIFAGAVIVGKAAGDTVIVLDTEAKALPQESVAVQVSVTVPPQADGVALKVDGLEVPLIAQLPDKPLLNANVLGEGNEPQATVIFEGAVIVGRAAGETVMVLETGANALPQESVAVHVSVTVPPQDPTEVEKVDGFEVPVIKHPPLAPFVKVSVLGAGKAPQATVMLAGAVNVGKAAGLTVIFRLLVIVLPKKSVKVQDSTIVPPQEGDEGFVGVSVPNVDITLPLIAQAPETPLV